VVAVSSAEEEGKVKCPAITTLYTGLAIREFLMALGKGSPYHFYKCFKAVKPTTSYLSVVKYFYILSRLGLVEVVGTEPSSKKGIERKLYRIVPGREDDPRWMHPQQALYPDTRWGSRRYWKVKGR